MLYMHLSLLHITKNLKMVYICDAIFLETVPYYIILIIITLIHIYMCGSADHVQYIHVYM